MKFCRSKNYLLASLFPLLAVLISCQPVHDQETTKQEPKASTEVTTRGSLEVTAELIEIPDGAIFERDLYNYTTILKYRIQTVHRGKIKTEIIFVGHYNPFKPRGEAADRRAPKIGGSLERFQKGQIHRMALEVPIDNFYMGGIINKYFDETPSPIYWGVWTDLGSN